MPSPPDSSAPEPLPRRPVPARPPLPPRNYAAEQEAARLLTQANIQLRRGQPVEARKAVDALLVLRPADAAAHEMLADIYLSENNFDGAQAALKTALTHEPGRATAEAKLGRAALRRREQERMQTMGVAYAADHAALVRFSGEGSAQKGWLPPLASAFLPGLGQLIEGETVKGAALMGVTLLGLLALTLMPGTRALLQQMASPFAAHAGRGAAAPGGASGFLLVLLSVVWLYSVIDAARAAARRAAGGSPKSGWEV